MILLFVESENVACRPSVDVADDAMKVEIVDGKVQVKARRSALEKTKRLKPMAAYSPSVKTKVLIIGGG